MSAEPAYAVPWSPILDGEMAERAALAVSAVAEALGDAPLSSYHAASPLATGEAGVALFFDYLDRARPDAGYAEIALARLERAIDTLAGSLQAPSLYAGFTGVSWAAEHFQASRGAAEDGEDPNEDVDALLLKHLRQTPWKHHFDLTSGLTGHAVYALERLPRPSGAECLELAVERLAEIARPRPVGLAWYTPPELLHELNRPWYPQGYDNLGVAHGTPGVIGVLARAVAAGVAESRARSLLAEAVPWLLAQKLPAGGTSIFPYAVGIEVRVRPGRTGWCYGDPGIAQVLLAAGRAMGEPDWEREALDLARAVARRSPEGCGVDDAGLCHGAAGLAHLLNRLYQATGDPELGDAARAWFGRVLDFWQPGRGIGGFLAFTPPDDDPDQLAWNAEPGFLGGAAGMALALLAATTDVDPAWDRLLLASPLPGRSAPAGGG